MVINTKTLLERQTELTRTLREAAREYYSGEQELMSNFEYDKLYDELAALETETGIVLAGSPTLFVGFEVASKLKKDTHEYPALSLEKTKSAMELLEWLNDRHGVMMTKLDGNTIQATFDDGKLVKAVTRGDGLTGECLKTATFFHGLPGQIQYKGHLVVRGEALISYKEFERINRSIANTEEKYKNPRNLAAGTVRQLDNRIALERDVQFIAFSLVFPELATFTESLSFLSQNGFAVVDAVPVDKDNLLEVLHAFETAVTEYAWPVDGLVLTFNDTAYGKSRGCTNKCDKKSIAFKWKDEAATTVLREIQWSASRTGLLNPVAVFDPVELEGTTVCRASVHNVSVIRQLQLGIGDSITVYKANMIIPQLAENLTKSNTAEPPSVCPVCASQTHLRHNNDTDTVFCPNAGCAAKQIGRFVHFVCRDALNIDGLSDMTLERLIDAGYVKNFSDLFELDRYKSEICKMDGFGEKSYQNLVNAIEKSRTVKFENFLYALGIPNVGRDASKRISKFVNGDFDAFTERLRFGESFAHLDGIGPTIDASIWKWKEDSLYDVAARSAYCDLVDKMRFILPEISNTHSSLAGKIFVITGTVERFANRDALTKHIESLGGSVTGSVSAKTSYLINNDNTSGSSKNKAAQNLGIPILTEEMFLSLSR